MKKQLIKSSTFRTLEVIIITVISLVLTPYLIHHLGDAHYGLWILILSALGWFNFIDLGFAYAVQRNIVLALENKDNHRINIVFSVAVALFSVLGFIAAFCVLVLAFFPELLGINEKEQSIATIAFSILAIKVFLDFIMNCFHGFFTAYLRMDIDANLGTLNMVVKSILVFYLIIDMNIYGAVFATIAADILTHSLKMHFARKLHPEFKFVLHLVKFSEVRQLFAFSKHLILMGMAKSVNRRVDPIIISHLLGLKFVAIYNVINSLMNQVESLVGAIVGVFQPVLTKMVARNTGLDGTFKLIISINFFTVILLYMPLAILAEDFITLWIGLDYAQAGQLAPILGFAYICRTVSRPISSLLLAKAQHQLLSVVNLLGALLNIGLSLVLGSQWGLLGIAIATACSFFVSDVILHLVLLNKYTELPVLKPILEFIKLVVLYILLVVLGISMMQLFEPLNWGQLIIAAIACVCIALLIAWPMLLDKEVKQKLLGMLIKTGKAHD
ncbi:lipopolysaccharide biosynthesis protein [Colwellia psychrerythraea]|uniref:Putative polysaccharide biosynthesis protein n=1 Tax=Colwellia psychrerythraea (strain 34H / ATCC BAA-681) TaxID=167879 RepID=Q47U72_COLP3|nr:oligosaccharide flippase family protein [Colwellia psychrerythraea]AAZ28116.1 putative polysaccharide biosynthesis protein [Colwellia psychrerythraea 34H]